MQIKLSKNIPKEEGLYFHSVFPSAEEIPEELVYISNDKELWVHDYPYMKSKILLSEYEGLWSEKLEFLNNS